MISHDDTPRLDRLEQLSGMGWVKWGCYCCGPKDNTDHSRANRYARRKARMRVKLQRLEDDG